MPRSGDPVEVRPMKRLLNIHSILKFHGPCSPEEVSNLLLDRGIFSAVDEVIHTLNMDASQYFMIRRTTNLKGSWEALR
jgi:hypothetical protein